MWSMHLMCIHKVFMMTPAKDSCKRIIINGKHGTHLAPGKLWKWAYSVLASWEKKHIKCAKTCIYFAHDIDMQGYAVPARRLSSSSSSSHSSHFALLSHFHARKTLISSKTTVATHATHPPTPTLKASTTLPPPLWHPQHPVLLYPQELLLSGFFNWLYLWNVPTHYSI